MENPEKEKKAPRQDPNNNNNNNNNNNLANSNSSDIVEQSGKLSTYDPLDLENYYDALSKFTFSTEFIQLSEETAQAIIDCYDDLKYQRHDDHPELKMTEKKKHLLKQLEQQIDAIIQKYDCDIFCRLSTRSPKDVAIKGFKGKTKQIFETEKEKLHNQKNIGDGDIISIIALIRATTMCLKMSSGGDVVRSFVESERVYQDLFRRILSTKEEEPFDMKIVVRKWIDIQPELEFRGFCHNGRLNGLTQYYKICFVPELVTHRDHILKKILDFFHQVQPILSEELHLDNYVIDFAYHQDQVYLVENELFSSLETLISSSKEENNNNFISVENMTQLNHWGTTASSSLFSWKEDWEVLHHGPFDFRILNQPVENVGDQIATPLKELLSLKILSNPSSQPQDQKKKTFPKLFGSSPKKLPYEKALSHLKQIQPLNVSSETLNQIDLKKMFGLTGLYCIDSKDGRIFWQFTLKLFKALGANQEFKSAVAVRSDFSTALVVLVFYQLMTFHKSTFEKLCMNETLKKEFIDRFHRGLAYLQKETPGLNLIFINVATFLKNEVWKKGTE